jgi:hypothetical protein
MAETSSTQIWISLFSSLGTPGGGGGGAGKQPNKKKKIQNGNLEPIKKPWKEKM